MLSYEELLRILWASHDPTEPPWHTQYQAAVFYRDVKELDVARATGELAAHARGGELRTRIAPLDRFYRAEDYHQKYTLRRERALMAELVERYGSDEKMVDSTAAARINGLLYGHGSKKALEELERQLGLSASSLKVLRARV